MAYCGYQMMKLNRGRQLIISVVVGGSVALLLSGMLLWTSRVQLLDDVYWSSIIMTKYWSHCITTQIYDPNNAFNNKVLYWQYFLRWWWITVIIGGGIVEWVVIGFKKRGVELWVGCAVIVGVIISWATCPFGFLQNFLPGLLCLMFFTPYIAFFLKKPVLQLIAVLVLLGLSVQAIVKNCRDTMEQLKAKVAAVDFAERQKLLDLIPRTERVVGLNESHPCFREDQTFVTYDERWGNPPGFTPIIPKDSGALIFFQPEYFAKSLNQSPPASIAFDEYNYPPGWNQVLQDFLWQHKDNYTAITLTSGQRLFVREDLLIRK
jgi:hypothetical protein